MVSIRPYTHEDIGALMELTELEDWVFFSEIDCRATLMVDPEGLLVAQDAVGKPVGKSISLV
jgi:hypothetical protein